VSPLEAPGIALLPPHQRIEPELPAIGRPEPNAGFDAVLKQALVSANGQIQAAEQAGTEFAAGRLDDIHGTMLAVSKADIDLRFVGSVRNKVMEAFYELWRMQI